MQILILILFFHFPISGEWKFVKQENGIKVYTRDKTGSSIKEFKAIVTLNCTKKQLKDELSDIKNMNKWYDMVAQVDVIKQFSPNEAAYRVLFDFPAMVSNRYSVIKAILTEDPKTQNFNIVTSFYNTKHEALSSCVYVTEIGSEWKISGKDGQVTVEHIGFMNPAGNIPEWLVNANLTDGPIRTITNLKSRACK